MPKLLIVTRVFPPKAGGGVQRMVKFAKYLPEHGWETIVVAPAMYRSAGWHDPSPMAGINADHVIRVGMHQPKGSTTKRALKKIYPIDAEYPWSHQVIANLQAREDLNFDAVLTSGPPHSVHRVGASLSRHSNTPWIADFRDHYTLNPEYKPRTPFHRFYDRRFETRILDHATAVICNTRINRRELLAHYGIQYAPKVTTIYNGFDYSDLKTHIADDVPQFSPERTNYVYLGGLRGGEIDDAFFRVIAAMRQSHPQVVDGIAIRILGDPSRRTRLCQLLIEQGIVHLHSAIPANAIGAVICQADACLTWQRDLPRYRGTIAGKVFDYLAMKKPIFALGQPGGEVDQLLRRFHIGDCVSPADTQHAAQSLAQFARKVKAGGFRFHESSRCGLQQFSRPHQAAQLATLLNAVT